VGSGPAFPSDGERQRRLGGVHGEVVLTGANSTMKEYL
jgi:hypothetical protein